MCSNSICSALRVRMRKNVEMLRVSWYAFRRRPPSFPHLGQIEHYHTLSIRHLAGMRGWMNNFSTRKSNNFLQLIRSLRNDCALLLIATVPVTPDPQHSTFLTSFFTTLTYLMVFVQATHPKIWYLRQQSDREGWVGVSVIREVGPYHWRSLLGAGHPNGATARAQQSWETQR